MKKYIKILSFCFIIGITFFVGGINKVKADRELFTCYYADEDSNSFNEVSNQNVVELRLWVYQNNRTGPELKGEYKVTKYKGDKKSQRESFGKNDIRKEQEERIFATNQCPEAIVVVKRKTWWVYSGTLEEMKSLQKSEGDAAQLVVIKTADNDKVKKISTFNQAINEYMAITVYTGTGPIEPKTVNCVYTDNNTHTWSINISDYHTNRMKLQYNKYQHRLDDNGCPDTVFKVTDKNRTNDSDGTGYVFFGEANGTHPDWPRLCTDQPDRFKCEYLTNRHEYGEYSKPVTEIPWDYYAEFYLLKGFGGVDYNNVLTITANGTNLKLENVSIDMNGNKAGLASFDGTKDDFNKIMFANQNGLNYIGCYEKEKAEKNEWKLLHDTESDFKYYCNFMSKDGFFGMEKIQGDYKYARKGEASRNYDINTIAGANNYFLTLCQDCKSNPNGYGCDKMDQAYDIIQNHIFKCRNILGSENDKMKKECEKLMTNNLKQWSKEDCFNGRIIVNNSNYGCDTLGGLGDWLSKIYTIIKFAVPILIIAMGIKDFVQALTSGKDDALKKAGNSFIKRLIMGAVFVILPILIEMILTIALGGSFADMCITI